MFKTTSIGVAMLLLSESEASHIHHHRHPHNNAMVQEPDSDIAMTQQNIASSEQQYGKFEPVQNYLGIWKVGADANFVQTSSSSDPICSSAGCNQYKSPASKEVNWPMNYGVPSFGMDRDVMNSLQNIKIAEDVVGKNWSPGNNFGSGAYAKKYQNPAKKVDYNFIPELDGDVKDSIKNLSDSEERLQHQYTLLQTDAQSDPICSSAGCTQYKSPASKEVNWPMNYGVPSFGMDRDIMASLNSIKEGEDIVGKRWNPSFGSGEYAKKYQNPARKVDYNFAPELDDDIKTSAKNLADSEEKLQHEYQL